MPRYALCCYPHIFLALFGVYSIMQLRCVRRHTQGLHRSLNVLEFDFVTQVPLNVLEFMAVFLNVLENISSINDCMFGTWYYVNCFNYF